MNEVIAAIKTADEEKRHLLEALLDAIRTAVQGCYPDVFKVELVPMEDCFYNDTAVFNYELEIVFNIEEDYDD